MKVLVAQSYPALCNPSQVSLFIGISKSEYWNRYSGRILEYIAGGFFTV